MKCKICNAPSSDICAYPSGCLKLCEKIDRLAAENAAWVGSATYGTGSPCMTPSDLEKAIKGFITEREAQKARIAELEVGIERGAKAAAEELVRTAFYMVENGANYSTKDEQEGFTQVILQHIKAALERSDDA